MTKKKKKNIQSRRVTCVNMSLDEIWGTSDPEGFSGFVVISKASPKCWERASESGFIGMPSLCQLLFLPYLPAVGILFFFFFWCEMLSLNISSLCSTHILTWYFRRLSRVLGIGAIIWYQSSMTSWWEGVVRRVLAAQFSRWVSGYSVIYPLLCHCVWKMLSAGTWAKKRS